MATLALNAGEGHAPLAGAVARLAPGAPIVVMVHGFRYCPGIAAADPHRHILADRPQINHWKAVSWPARLGLHREHGLAIGFGWRASGSIWNAYGRAPTAARDLAALLRRLATEAPGHPVHLIAHSLGARVALLGASDAGSVHRAIVIHPAMFRREAASLSLPRTEIFSVLGSENTAYDMLLRAALPLNGATLGRSGPPGDGWLDLRLSHGGTVAALTRMGYPIAQARARVCHWSGYLREGVWDLYRALIHSPGTTPIHLMRTRLTPAQNPQADAGAELIRTV